MNSGQNIKNSYMKVPENEKQAGSKGGRRVNSWKKEWHGFPFFMAFGQARVSRAMRGTKIQIKAWKSF